MKRVSLGGGRWFDENAATCFDAAKYFDGRNMIYKCTGSQWNGEALYLTKGGQWLLNSWSAYAQGVEHYEPISQKEAHEWLIDNGHAEEVPGDVVAAGEV